MEFPELREITPKEALRFEYVLEQERDASCGYSAAASLLTLYWGLEARESELIGTLSELAEGELSYRVSLADIALMIEKRGLKTIGLDLNWTELLRIIVSYAPLIAHYDRPEKHFALLIGHKDERIVTADPIRGLELLSETEFMERWSGKVLVAASDRFIKCQETITEAVASTVRRYHITERIASRLW